MKPALPLQQYPLRERTWLYALLSALLFAWLCMMFASSARASGVAAGIRNLFGVAVLFAAAAGAVQMKSLARAAEFLCKQQMPHSLWRAWLRSCVAETSVVCALLCAAMVSLLASRGSMLPWLAGIALISAALSLAAIAVLHHHSMIARRLGWLSNTAGCVLLLAVSSVGAAWMVDAIAAWPTPVLLLLALSWPSLAASLMAARGRQLDALRAARGGERAQRLAPLLSQLRRFSPLEVANWRLLRRGLRGTRRELLIGWLFYIGAPIYFYFNDLKPLGWNDAPDARHLISLIALGLVMTLSLMARDLHWRAMLMPGGWRHRRIASDIFSATLKTQYAMLVATAGSSVVIQCLVQGIKFGDAVHVVANHTLLLAAIPLSISTALVIRALPRSNWVKIALALALGAIWLHVRFNIGYANLAHLPAGGLTYSIVMAALTWPILALANRMWTPEKLMACARSDR